MTPKLVLQVADILADEVAFYGSPLNIGAHALQALLLDCGSGQPVDAIETALRSLEMKAALTERSMKIAALADEGDGRVLFSVTTRRGGNRAALSPRQVTDIRARHGTPIAGVKGIVRRRVPVLWTAERLAAQYGVTARTIYKVLGETDVYEGKSIRRVG